MPKSENYKWVSRSKENMDLFLNDFLLLYYVKRSTAAVPTAELRDAFPEMSRTQIYKRLDVLRKRGLLESFRLKTLPAYSVHTVTDAGVAVIREFRRRFAAAGK